MFDGIKRGGARGFADGAEVAGGGGVGGEIGAKFGEPAQENLALGRGGEMGGGEAESGIDTRGIGD